jgi:hypothetical protein
MESPREKLLKSIRDSGTYQANLARIDHAVGLILLLLAIGSSGTAALLGFATQVRSSYIGALALVPGSLALLATTVKFDARAQWHFDKKRALNGLERRLEFEMPNPPTADQIALIANELTKIHQTFGKRWSREFGQNWAWARHGHNGK